MNLSNSVRSFSFTNDSSSFYLDPNQPPPPTYPFFFFSVSCRRISLCTSLTTTFTYSHRTSIFTLCTASSKSRYSAVDNASFGPNLFGS
jgi:hypothetical protein